MVENFSREGITVVLPAHNEEDNIEPMVEETIRFLTELHIPHQIIVVDDGSTDGTGRIADVLARRHTDIVTVATQPYNMKYGAAIRRGFAEALKTPHTWVFFTDSDRQFDIRELKLLLDEQTRSESDMVIGYRIKRADPFHRKIFAKGWTTVCKMTLRFSARDVDCAFKLINRRVIENIPPLKGDGAAVNPELLAKAKREGFTFVQVGVNHYPRRAGEQSGSNLKVIVRSFTSLWKVWLELRHSGKGMALRGNLLGSEIAKSETGDRNGL